MTEDYRYRPRKLARVGIARSLSDYRDLSYVVKC